jgi:DNA-binding response OmpR family regulator
MYRLLIVGSDGPAERSCRQELEAEGFDVDVISDPEKAATRVRDRRPDVVILDLCMPQGQEIDCLESVRCSDHTVPVVLHTTHPEPWGDFRLWSADSFVKRSDDPSGLKEAVQDLLREETG